MTPECLKSAAGHFACCYGTRMHVLDGMLLEALLFARAASVPEQERG